MEVCKTWNGLARKNALNRRKQLAIVQNKQQLSELKRPGFSQLQLLCDVRDDDGKPYEKLRIGIENDALIFSERISSYTLLKITTVLPNLSTIRIVQKAVSIGIYRKICTLIAPYREKLTDFTLIVSLVCDDPDDDGRFNQNKMDFIFNLFWDSLNLIKNLTRLQFNHSSWIHYHNQKLDYPGMASVVSKVKSLHLSIDGAGNFANRRLLCTMIDKNNNLEELSCQDLNSLGLSARLESGQHFLHNPRARNALQSIDLSITRLSSAVNIDSIKSLAQLYPNLRELAVSLIEFPLINFMVMLSSIGNDAFRNLVQLDIDNISVFSHLNDVALLPEFPSVKVLR